MLPLLPLLVDGSSEFDVRLAQIVRRGSDDLDAVAPAVREILAEVQRDGEKAVRRYVEKFEHRAPAELVLREYDGAGALERLDAPLRAALELAAERIARYHQRQVTPSFAYEEDGIELGMRVRPLARVGVYAPGGKARYPSSVLMAAIPARVAGVREIVLATPAPNDLLLAAAHLAGVATILDAGGAHAIGALAYGLSNLPRVDKIVGPGNAYVACAKKLVFGDVAIDAIAGPSEIVALADDEANPAFVAADILSQAEHDEAAHAILITTSRSLAERVRSELETQFRELSRQSIVAASLSAHGTIFVVESRARMLELANLIGAEHVSLHLAEAERATEGLHAGAVLVGGSTPVAAADYLAGPSHVLPTGGGARYGSPLGVYDFVARTSVIRYAPDAIRRQAPAIAALARAEGLDAHARAAEIRARAAPAKMNGASSRAEPPAGGPSSVRESQSDP